MFVKSVRWDTNSGQHARGPFLILVCLEEGPLEELRAFVRHVRLDQCGHFMMGDVTIGGVKLTLSGSYGNDGLPVTVNEKLYCHAVPIPDKLFCLWNKGGGHNSCGSEAPLLRDWAMDNLKALRKPVRELCV